MSVKPSAREIAIMALIVIIVYMFVAEYPEELDADPSVVITEYTTITKIKDLAYENQDLSLCNYIKDDVEKEICVVEVSRKIELDKEILNLKIELSK